MTDPNLLRAVSQLHLACDSIMHALCGVLDSQDGRMQEIQHHLEAAGEALNEGQLAPHATCPDEVPVKTPYTKSPWIGLVQKDLERTDSLTTGSTARKEWSADQKKRWDQNVEARNGGSVQKSPWHPMTDHPYPTAWMIVRYADGVCSDPFRCYADQWNSAKKREIAPAVSWAHIHELVEAT